MCIVYLTASTALFFSLGRILLFLSVFCLPSLPPRYAPTDAGLLPDTPPKVQLAVETTREVFVALLDLVETFLGLGAGCSDTAAMKDSLNALYVKRHDE